MAARAPATAVTTYDKLMWPTLQALAQLGGSANVQEIEDAVIKLAHYTEEQQKVLHGDGPRTEIWYRLHWARTYLGKVGALENSRRGVWALTDYGRTLTGDDMPAVVTKVRAMLPKPKKAEQEAETTTQNKPAAAEPESPSDSTSPDAEDWRDQLLAVLQDLPPGAFERLCQRLLREEGFIKVEVTGRSGDGGIDGIGILRLSMLTFPVFFQCKRYKGSVGPSAVRDFRGAMVGRTDKGLLITTGTFTPDAKKEASRDGAPVLDLVDANDLCEWLERLQLGVKTELVPQTTVNPAWFADV
jgi:restriction system protein